MSNITSVPFYQAAFGRLPPELRNRIYKFALQHPHPIEVAAILPNNDPSAEYEWPLRLEDRHPLTSTCKAVRHECWELFININTFIIPSHPHWHGMYNSEYTYSVCSALESFFRSIGARGSASASIVILDIGKIGNGSLHRLRQQLQCLHTWISTRKRARMELRLRVILGVHEPGCPMSLDVDLHNTPQAISPVLGWIAKALDVMEDSTYESFLHDLKHVLEACLTEFGAGEKRA